MKAQINFFILVSIVCIGVVKIINFNWILYGFFFILHLVLLGMNFDFKKNIMFFKKVFIVNCIFYCVCIVSDYNNILEDWTNLDNLLKVIIQALMTMFFFLMVYYIIFKNKNNITKGKRDKEKILDKRKEDLDLLKEYLRNFNIIGVNGGWGSGKTFLLDQLKEELTNNINKNNYEFIEISLLTINLNEFQLTLINSFEEILLKNRIKPVYANKLKQELSNYSVIGNFKWITTMFFKNSDLKSEILLGFQKEIENLNKTVIISYEEIDRINDLEIIKEIFSVSESISSENVKVIYQYDEEKLIEKNLTHEFIEKYIPININITYIHFVEIIRFFIKEDEGTKIEKNDFNFLKEGNTRFNMLRNLFSFDKDYSYILEYPSIRRIEYMLKELNIVFTRDEALYKQHKDIVISFFVLKHLNRAEFEKLTINHGLLESFKFEYETRKMKQMSFLEMYKMYSEETLSKEDIIRIFEKPKNQKNYGILKMFNYPIKFDINDAGINFLTEKSILDIEKNDKVINKLIFTGLSNLTTHEVIINQLCDQILIDISFEEKVKRFGNFNEEWKSNNIKQISGYKTVFKLGKDQFETLFEMFKVKGVSSDFQMKLLEFYFEYKKPAEFNLEVVMCLKNIDNLNKKDVMSVIEKINKLKLVGNFSEFEKEFHLFFENYIRLLVRHGLIDLRYTNLFRETDSIKSIASLVLQDLEHLRQRINSLNLNSCHMINSDIKVIEEFFKKNLELYELKDKVKKANPLSIKMWEERREEVINLQKLYETNNNDIKTLSNLIVTEYEKENISLNMLGGVRIKVEE